MADQPKPIFADGRPTLENDGPTQIGVTTANGKVVVAFAEPVDWIGMEPEQAFTIAMLIIRNAVELDPSLEEGIDFEENVDFITKQPEEPSNGR